MPTRAQLLSKAEAFQLYLDKLEVSESVRFNKIIKKLDRNIQAMLAKVDGNLSELSNAQLNKLLKELATVNKRDLDKSSADMLERLESFSAYSYAVEASALASMNREVARALLHAATKRQIWKEALSRPLGATGDMLESFIKDLTARQASAIDKIIRKGFANSYTTSEMTRILRGTKAKGYADGLMSKLGKQTTTVVRTAMQHINNSARQTLYAENSDIVEGYEWVSTLDSRTSEECQDLDGEVFKMGEGPIPPAHPNCRSTTIPKLNKDFDILDQGATRSSEFGYVPADLTYHQWREQYDEE